MNFFEEATLRLKQQLHTTQDKEIASALGLSAQSWAGRKKRENFPEVELYALAAKRPDLKINVEYVLTGRAAQPMTAQGRDDYLMGKIASLEVMVQTLMRNQPHAEQLQAAFVQQIKDVEAALAGESLSDDFVRGLHSGEAAFRLPPVGAASKDKKKIEDI
ncbi:hypothetical protein [Comamonas fluminis]|uniref:hypothetical protein n=1 Tax=Comamonas fluminis TaxID=2796366 RepID=UPI001C46BA2E|nr:hypothetical protein [Comamonas fluminis]